MSTAPATGQLTPAELRERIARLPRIPFAAAPTPLESLPRLSAALGGPRIFVKRDDLTGFAFGGNKVRALEFRMADALKKGADTFIVVNLGQSNHARLHSAAATRLGLHMIIVKPGPKNERVQGNLLLDRMLGVEIVETGTTDPAELDRIVDGILIDLQKRGHTAYVAPHDPFSALAGTIAYTEVAIELHDQFAAAGLKVDHVFMVAGTSCAGLRLGTKLLGYDWKIQGVSVGDPGPKLPEMILGWANGAAEQLGLPHLMTQDDFIVHDAYIGDQYSDVTPAVLEAVRLTARTDALFLDPVYTGKAMAGLIGEIRSNRIGKDETVVFVHTGGLPIIFQYDHILTNL